MRERLSLLSAGGHTTGQQRLFALSSGQTDRRAGQPDSHFTAGLQERLIPGQSPSGFMHRPNTGQTVLHVFSLGSVLFTQATDVLTLFTWAANNNKIIKTSKITEVI